MRQMSLDDAIHSISPRPCQRGAAIAVAGYSVVVRPAVSFIQWAATVSAHWQHPSGHYCQFESLRIIVSKCFDFISSVFRYPGAQSLLSKSSLARRTLSAASSERSGLTRAKSHEPAGMAITAIIHQCDAQRHLLGLESKAHRFLCLIF